MKLLDKEFDLFLSHEEIEKRVKELSEELDEQYKDRKPLFITILNGAFIFAADLMKHSNIQSEISFVKLASYVNTQSSGEVNQLIGLVENIYNRHIVILEDIVDTGYTIQNINETLNNRGAKSIEICSLLVKPDSIKVDHKVKFVGFDIPNDFVIGYGMDYEGFGRNLKDIYKIKS